MRGAKSHVVRTVRTFMFSYLLSCILIDQPSFSFAVIAYTLLILRQLSMLEIGNSDSLLAYCTFHRSFTTVEI